MLYRTASVVARPRFSCAPSQVEAKTRGGLIYASQEFFAFVVAIEKVYLFNLTDDKLDAYPSTLATKIQECVQKSEEPRRILGKLVTACMPLEYKGIPPPEAFFVLIFKKYAMMRNKDLARSLNRAHASERSMSATAGGVTHRAALATISAAASKKARTQ